MDQQSGDIKPGGRSGLFTLTLTAVGVVYGDIGTSPLYAMRECFFGSHSVPPTPENILGVLSLIIYSLLIVISIKYIVVVMRADNQGEGGILALTALLPGSEPSLVGVPASKPRAVLIGLGIFGAALLYGDGMITPAISVLGAVEGLHVVTPRFTPYIVPLAVLILFCLFVLQRFGTHRVGGLFGPIMLVWFVAIAALGLIWIFRAPAVLRAFNPGYAAAFFQANHMTGFTTLGAVVLVVTGGEALYADMGHFGRRPIRLAWFILVLPALVVNYFGQGALLLERTRAEQPFFMLAPPWALLPLVGIATAAAVIASQALISGAFSLTRQAIQLGYAPRLDVEHTSSREIGQVYVPHVNAALAVCTILIVVTFKSSSALAAAYGIAVTLTMVITAVLLYAVAKNRWKWPSWIAYCVTGIFLSIDLAFFGANLLKLFHGGWLPIVIGAFLFTLMMTWKAGRSLVATRMNARALPVEEFIASLEAKPPVRVSGTAVFMTAQPHGTPPALVHNLRYNKVLHECVILLNVQTSQAPYVKPDNQIALQALSHGLCRVQLQYGFMDEPNVPDALRLAREKGLDIKLDDTTYFLGRETILATKRPGMAIWREKLFMMMTRSAARAMQYFSLPSERVVEIGVQVDI
jgi:KUP system potassium uptake protein